MASYHVSDCSVQCAIGTKHTETTVSATHTVASRCGNDSDDSGDGEDGDDATDDAHDDKNNNDDDNYDKYV